MCKYIEGTLYTLSTSKVKFSPEAEALMMAFVLNLNRIFLNQISFVLKGAAVACDARHNSREGFRQEPEV